MLLIMLIFCGALYGSQVTTAAKSEFAVPHNTPTSLALQEIEKGEICGALLSYRSIKNPHRKRRVLEKIASAAKPLNLNDDDLKTFAQYVANYNDANPEHKRKLSTLWQHELTKHESRLGKQYGIKK
jgi:hypothetical protein